LAPQLTPCVQRVSTALKVVRNRCLVQGAHLVNLRLVSALYVDKAIIVPPDQQLRPSVRMVTILTHKQATVRSVPPLFTVLKAHTKLSNVRRGLTAELVKANAVFVQKVTNVK
jgi:hypothetical protein